MNKLSNQKYAFLLAGDASFMKGLHLATRI
jgi:hypothetical protein